MLEAERGCKDIPILVAGLRRRPPATPSPTTIGLLPDQHSGHRELQHKAGHPRGQPGHQVRCGARPVKTLVMCCEPVLAAGHVFGHGERVSSAHLDLRPVPESAGVARRFVSEQAGAVDESVGYRLSLLTSEVVTNAVLHARTALQVGLTHHHDGLMVAVGDRNLALPEQHPYSEQSNGGRGIPILEQLADDWGITTYEGGKTVWFVVWRPMQGRPAQ